jgi:hypothetical protein
MFASPYDLAILCDSCIGKVGKASAVGLSFGGLSCFLCFAFLSETLLLNRACLGESLVTGP